MSADRAVAVLRLARGKARHRVWSRCRPLGGTPGTRDGEQVIVDIDATLVTAHSDKEGAQPTHKKSYGFAPMCAFVDHGEHGTGETLTLDLRPGKASPFNSADHIAVMQAALQQLPEGERGQVLVRADAGGASKAFLHHVTDAGLQYSIGFPAHGPVQAAIETIPEQACVAALDSDGKPRESAQVAELTNWSPSRSNPPAKYGPQEWPHGMGIIARRERPHPGAQLRLTDHNGWRITCFATNTRGIAWTLATLEVRHRQRARAEVRIRCLKDTGLRNLPFHNYHANRIWLEVVDLAAEPDHLDPDSGLRRTSPGPQSGICRVPAGESVCYMCKTLRESPLRCSHVTDVAAASWLMLGRLDCIVVPAWARRGALSQ